jgi:hypothetical protein
MGEVQISGTAFYLVPTGKGRNSWAFFLNYSNQRSFLDHIPLPGAAYIWSPSRKTFAMIGLPIAFLRTSPFQDLSLEFFYFPPIRGRIKMAYAWNSRWTSYLLLRSDRDAFLRADRTDDDAWLRHSVVEANLGLGCQLNRHFSLDLSVGYAFDRQVYESDSFSEDGDAIELEPGPLASLRLRAQL